MEGTSGVVTLKQAMASEGSGARLDMHAEGREIESGEWETTCWGCNLRLLLRHFAPIFKCGYCGAVTIYKPQPKPGSRCSPLWGVAVDRILVFLVLVLIISIVYGGVWTTFPILFPKVSFGFYVHSIITALLAFNSLFNFAFAASVPAGPTPPVDWGQYEVVGRGGLEGYRFCGHCQKPKHPRAHHCRTCSTCVVDMDHHCPFIGNCVGARNHGYFLLFLGFTTLSCIYILIMSAYSFNYSWPSLTEVHYDPLAQPGASVLGLQVMADVLSALFFDNQVVFSVRYVALLYLFVTSFAVLIGAGLLLYQQLALVYSGQTYLDSITFRDEADSGVQGTRGWTNLRRVFGKRHPLLWFFPSTNSRKFHVI